MIGALMLAAEDLHAGVWWTATFAAVTAGCAWGLVKPRRKRPDRRWRRHGITPKRAHEICRQHHVDVRPRSREEYGSARSEVEQLAGGDDWDLALERHEARRRAAQEWSLKMWPSGLSETRR